MRVFVGADFHVGFAVIVYEDAMAVRFAREPVFAGHVGVDGASGDVVGASIIILAEWADLHGLATGADLDHFVVAVENHVVAVDGVEHVSHF